MTSKKVSQKIAKKNLKLRKEFWPDVTDDMLWNRTKKTGFTTIPRVMPYFLRIMDDLSSGKPVSSTYLVLWCHTFDENMVKILNPREWAFESGFSGERCERTWRSRMEILEELGFIKVKPGASGPYNYVLILNPFISVKNLKKNRVQIREDRYNALIQRASDVGANDFE